jgi:GxxExxY protein
MLEHRDLTDRIIGAAIEVHRIIGPGLLESAYTECLAFELRQAGIDVQREVAMPIRYKDQIFPLGFRADMLVAGAVLLEIKAVAELHPAHDMQLRTYLRMSGIRVGLLLNFHARLLRDGLRRFIV